MKDRSVKQVMLRGGSMKSERKVKKLIRETY
jgi:hypothetical protein